MRKKILNIDENIQRLIRICTWNNWCHLKIQLIARIVDKQQILSDDKRISLKHHEMSFICREKTNHPKKKHI